MEAAFWHRCWERNSLGFHQETVHPFLDAHIKSKLSASDKRVFVPLCGKSLDMMWLAERLDLVGNELSDIACRDFFTDNGIEYQHESVADFNRYYFENVSLYQGDFFKFSHEIASNFDVIYDRAAIIALPRSLQAHYAKHLISFIGDNTKLFLISLEFPEDELEGPPFPVFEQDIRQLFSGLTVECIASRNLEDKQFAQRVFDVSYLTERLYQITK